MHAWMDYDNDGDKDLIISGEWMKVCIQRMIRDILLM